MTDVEWAIVIALVAIGITLVIYSSLSTGAYRKNSSRINDNAWRIVAAAKLGPFFYETEIGNNRVLVRKEDYDSAFKKWKDDIRDGTILVSEPILLMVHPALSFFQSLETRANMAQVGSWEDVRRLKMEALRRVSGLTQEEFDEAWGGSTISHSLWGKWRELISVRTSHIYIPFSSEHSMSRVVQEQIFGVYTLESAREFLLGNLPKLK